MRVDYFGKEWDKRIEDLTCREKRVEARGLRFLRKLPVIPLLGTNWKTGKQIEGDVEPLPCEQEM